METRYFAQPYDITATGFFFETVEGFRAGIKAARKEYGQPVEEFEIQFIDGEAIDAALFEALGITQATIGKFIEKCDDWEEEQKRRVILAVGEAGYSFDLASDEPDDLDIDLYADMTLAELAYQFVDEGLFGDIPEPISRYVDYDAIARDLAFDYAETTIAGERYIYRAA